MTTWLVTGATGLLGGNALQALGATDQAVGVARSKPLLSPIPFEAVDLSDRESRAGLIERTGASAVLHAAAVSTIEAAETNPELAHEVNVVAAADLARQAREVGAAFIYVSSDAVFDGRTGAYAEDAPTSPQSEYGRSKARGEAAVMQANPAALVARVNFYGWSPSGHRSLAEFFYSRLREGVPTPGFTDVVVSTLHVGFLVDALRALVGMGARGVLHVASRESIDKYSFGRQLAEVFGLDPELVRLARSSDHLRVRRGSNLSLDVARAERLIGAPLPDQHVGLVRLRSERDSSLPVALRRFNTRIE